jgi:hypothetical protein
MATRNELVFGIDKVSIRNANTGVLYGILKVVGSMSITPTVEMVSNNKGKGQTWDVRAGASSVEGALAFDQSPLWIYDAFSDSTKTVGKVLIGKNGTVTANTSQPDFFGKVIVTTSSVSNSVTLNVHNLLDPTQNAITKVVTTTVSSPIALGSSASVFGFTLASGESFSVGDEFYIQSINFSTQSSATNHNGVQTFSGLETPPELIITASAQNETAGGDNFIIIHRAVSSAFATGFTQNAFQEMEVPFMCIYDDKANGYFSQYKAKQID